MVSSTIDIHKYPKVIKISWALFFPTKKIITLRKKIELKKKVDWNQFFYKETTKKFLSVTQSHHRNRFYILKAQNAPFVFRVGERTGPLIFFTLTTLGIDKTTSALKKGDSDSA